MMILSLWAQRPDIFQIAGKFNPLYLICTFFLVIEFHGEKNEVLSFELSIQFEDGPITTY